MISLLRKHGGGVPRRCIAETRSFLQCSFNEHRECKAPPALVKPLIELPRSGAEEIETSDDENRASPDSSLSPMEGKAAPGTGGGFAFNRLPAVDSIPIGVYRVSPYDAQ